MAPRLFALVKWLGGADDKKFTSGIPVEWIKGFNYDDFRSQNFDPTENYVIEWRSKQKEPPGGWPVYDGYVIEVSHRISQLENKLSALDGFLSPTKIIQTANDIEERDPKSSTSNSESNDGEKLTVNEDNITEVSEDDNSEVSKSKSAQPVKGGKRKKTEKKRGSDTIVNVPPKVGNIAASNNMQEAHFSGNDPLNQTKNADKIRRRKSQKDGEQSSEDENAGSVLSGIAPIDGKKSRTRLYQPSPNGADKYGPTLVRVEKELKLLRKRRYRNCEPDTTDSSEDEMKEIGRKESGIFITDAQWNAAKRAKSYTAMGINLMMSLFPMKTLLKSNLRGGQNKINKARGAPKFKGLDPKILDSLYYSVERHWPNQFNEGGLGTALNNKLTRLRAAEKRNLAQIDQIGDGGRREEEEVGDEQ